MKKKAELFMSPADDGEIVEYDQYVREVEQWAKSEYQGIRITSDQIKKLIKMVMLNQYPPDNVPDEVVMIYERIEGDWQEAKELIDGYFRTYSRIKEYMDECIASARERGYVETMLGRRRYLRDIDSRNAVVRGFAERNAINAPIQGSAADIIKIAMIRIQERIEREKLRSKMILQVHDELVFDVYRPELDALSSMVLSEMEKAYELSVPLVVDYGTGENWLEAH
jgi:hypothetical protein